MWTLFKATAIVNVYSALKQEAFEPPFPLPYAWGSKKVTLAIIF